MVDAVRIASEAELRDKGVIVSHGVAVFHHEGQVYAVDNRCPHMGFPLHRGSVCDGILTCHWHHARFDLRSGGTFDPFADDVPIYPVELRGGEVWLTTRPRRRDDAAYLTRRLEESLEQQLPLVTAKSVVGLLQARSSPESVLRSGALWGARYRGAGWGRGLTTLVAMAQLATPLPREQQVRALVQGLLEVADDVAGEAPRFALRPLDGTPPGAAQLRSWLRQFIEVRDAQGAERVVLSAISAGIDRATVAEMLFSAATDHFFLDTGHVVDFINKAFELCARVGWEHAPAILPTLLPELASARRLEEDNSWRHPIDLVELLEPAAAELPSLLAAKRRPWRGDEELADQLLEDDPARVVEAMLGALRQGAGAERLARAVAYAAALRVARFPTSNEFGDWDTVLHTFSYANAMHQAVRLAPSPAVVRGVLHGAMRVYLDRFLNVPVADLPAPAPKQPPAEQLLAELGRTCAVHGQVDEAGALTAAYLAAGYPEPQLRQTLSEALLVEDSLFHTIQMLEAGFRQADAWEEPVVRRNILVGTARYLAAHSPTNREREQTVTIALRLQRGEALYADRVLATVMFSDVVGSTARAAELGDSRWRQALEGYRAVVRQELEKHSGRELDAAGDGVLTLFDGPARAVACAAAIVAAVRIMKLEVRVGLHACELEVGGDRAEGIGLHIGRRVTDLAAAGEVLVTSTVRDLMAGSGVTFVDRGSHRLRGVPEEWRLYAALSEAPLGVAEVVH